MTDRLMAGLLVDTYCHHSFSFFLFLTVFGITNLVFFIYLVVLSIFCPLCLFLFYYFYFPFCPFRSVSFIGKKILMSCIIFNTILCFQLNDKNDTNNRFID